MPVYDCIYMYLFMVCDSRKYVKIINLLPWKFSAVETISRVIDGNIVRVA